MAFNIKSSQIDFLARKYKMSYDKVVDINETYDCKNQEKLESLLQERSNVIKTETGSSYIFSEIVRALEDLISNRSDNMTMFDFSNSKNITVSSYIEFIENILNSELKHIRIDSRGKIHISAIEKAAIETAIDEILANNTWLSLEKEEVLFWAKNKIYLLRMIIIDMIIDVNNCFDQVPTLELKKGLSSIISDKYLINEKIRYYFRNENQEKIKKIYEHYDVNYNMIMGVAK